MIKQQKKQKCAITYYEHADITAISCKSDHLFDIFAVLVV